MVLKMITEQNLIDWLPSGADIIVAPANGEPVVLLDMLESGAAGLEDVMVHQILPMQRREYMYGRVPNLSHTSYFLSGANRQAYHEGHVKLVPNHFHEVPKILRQSTKMTAIFTVVSPMDEHGYFSLGTQSDYISEFVGKVPFFIEINEHMPRTVGCNQIHVSQVTGAVEHHRPLVEVGGPDVSAKDKKIAEFVAEDIRHGDTIQIGIGSVPNAVTQLLKGHRHLGIHTELLTDGVVDLVEVGAVDGTEKKTHQGKVIATLALGTKRLYDFMHNNPLIELLPVSKVNHPCEIMKESNIVSVNATTEVDFYGQCASETIQGKYYSSTGGQADFARALHFAENGRGYICMHATAKDDTISRIRPTLHPGSIVSTSKNDVDHIVTEYGVAKLYGKSLSERTKALINIAHPKFREALLFEAKQMGLVI